MKKRMMKLFSPVIVLVLSFSFCRTVSYAHYSGTDSYWDKFSSDYYYRQMNKEQKELYDKLYEECMELLTTEKDCTNYVNGRLYTDYVEYDESLGSLWDNDILGSVVFNFMNSNPQFYFISSKIDNDFPRVALGVYEDFRKGSDRKSYTERFSSVIDGYMTAVNAEKTAIEKERLAHNKIVTRLSYGKSEYDQSSAGAFFTTSSVCAGYTEGLELLLNAAGFECVPVSSDWHEWLEVKLDGTWYAVDATWDDQVGSVDVPGERFFNVSDATLLAADRETDNIGGHEPSAYYYSRLNLPRCNYDYPDKDPSAKPDDPDVDGTGADDYGLTGTFTNEAGDTALFRVYNPNTWEHFYTTDVAERRNLILAGWNGEGIIGYFPTYASVDTEIMYRFRNPNTGDHHYTADMLEIADIRSAGWIPEGTSFYSLKQDKGVPIYRLYNPNAVTGIHHYTSDKAEKDYLVSLGWRDEGISCYASSTHYYNVNKGEK